MGEYWIPRIIHATRNPTVNDDSTKGIIIGQLWKNTSNGERFECVRNTATEAAWYKIVDYLDPNESTVPVYQDEIDDVTSKGNVLITPEIIYMSGVIDYPLTIPAVSNAMSIGPITISETVQVDGEWVVL